MSEAPEVPEAKDPFERRVAVTIAIIVAFIALLSNRGDDKKTEAIIASTRAADQWAFFQAKSGKEHAYAIQAKLLAAHGDQGALRDEFVAESARNAQDKAKPRAEAEVLQQIVERDLEINESCDHAVLVLQIAAVLCSLAIVARWHLLWTLGIVVGLGGMAFGATSFVERHPHGEASTTAAGAAPAAEH